MNKFSLIAAAAALALSATAASAAQGSATLNVTASVAAVCKLSLSGDMAFGALDPTATTDPTATATASYKCTKGTPVTSFTVNNVLTTHNGSMTGTGSGDTIDYEITWTAPAAFNGDGLGATAAARSVTLNGKILNADYVNATPDSYKGTVGIQVNY